MGSMQPLSRKEREKVAQQILEVVQTLKNAS
jgi:hypothetical protein